jgi:hypothetical protein
MKNNVRVIGVRVPESLYQAIILFCEQNNTDVSKLLRKAVVSALANPKSLS